MASKDKLQLVVRMPPARRRSKGKVCLLSGPVPITKRQALKYGLTGLKPTAHGRKADDVRVPVEAIWLEEPLGDEWIAAFLLVPQASVPVIAELRIFPREDNDPDRAPGEWSGRILGVKAKVPKGGVTARVARNVRLGVIWDALSRYGHAIRWFDWLVRKKGFPSSVDFVRSVRNKSKRPYNAGRPDIFYARIARDYERLVRAGVTNSNQRIASKMGVSTAKVRDMIYQARQRGLLTKPPLQGMQGGELTDKARALLRRAKSKVGGQHGTVSQK